MVTVLTQFAATEEAGIAALGLDPLAILAQAVTFLVLFALIKKFALNKIVHTLDERHKTIDKGVRLGFKMEEEKAALDEKVQEVLREARIEADRIIASGHQDAGSLIKEAEEATLRKTDALLADAHAKIEEDIKRARVQLEHEMLALVAQATETVIAEKIDIAKDAALLKRAINEVKS